MGKTSVRSCICCRKRSEKHLLLRFVLADEVVVFDEHHILPGRGAYVHPVAVCWSRMGDIRLWERAFRTARGTGWRESIGACMEIAREQSGEADIAPSVQKKGRKPVRL
jgi:predicted RNA-binding protein YlxR (DUF448 family)